MCDSVSPVGNVEQLPDVNPGCNLSTLKPYGFAIAIIVGVGSLAVLVGIGLNQYLQAGSLSQISQVNALIMMAAGGGGIIFLVVGIACSVKNCQKNREIQSPPITQVEDIQSTIPTEIEQSTANDSEPVNNTTLQAFSDYSEQRQAANVPIDLIVGRGKNNPAEYPKLIEQRPLDHTWRKKVSYEPFSIDMDPDKKPHLMANIANSDMMSCIPDSSVDEIYLEHLPPDLQLNIKTYCNAARMLKVNGVLIIENNGLYAPEDLFKMQTKFEKVFSDHHIPFRIHGDALIRRFGQLTKLAFSKHKEGSQELLKPEKENVLSMAQHQLEEAHRIATSKLKSYRSFTDYCEQREAVGGSIDLIVGRGTGIGPDLVDQRYFAEKGANVPYEPFCVDYDANTSPNLHANITKPETMRCIPDSSVDEIYLERLFPNKPLLHIQTYCNVARMLKMNGVLIIDKNCLCELDQLGALQRGFAETFKKYNIPLSIYTGQDLTRNDTGQKFKFAFFKSAEWDLELLKEENKDTLLEAQMSLNREHRIATNKQVTRH